MHITKMSSRHEDDEHDCVEPLLEGEQINVSQKYGQKNLEEL